MQSLRARRHALRQASTVHHVAQMPNLTPFTPTTSETGESRHEPQTFGASVPDDPYTAWLARREAEEERQVSDVRWVVRPRTLDGTATGAHAAGARVTRF
jgi:hypothetical protein